MRIVLLLLTVLLTGGCASNGNPPFAQDELTSQIKIGVSTKDDVRRLFGAPDFVSHSSTAGLHTTASTIEALPTSSKIEIWSYAHTEIETNPVTFIPIVGLFVGSSTINTASLAVTFDENGVVQNVTKDEGRATGGPGAP